MKVINNYMGRCFPRALQLMSVLLLLVVTEYGGWILQTAARHAVIYVLSY
jgi:hypothetical protein